MSKPRQIEHARLTYFLIISLASYFGVWFAEQQLAVIAPTAFATYPTPLFCLTVIKCVLTTSLFIAGSHLINLRLALGKIPLSVTALTYIPLLAVGHVTLPHIALAILALQLGGMLAVLRGEDYRYLAKHYLVDCLALGVLLCLHTWLTAFVSPLHWQTAMFSNLGFVGEEIPVQALIYKGYSLAKLFSFNNFDYSEWASVLNSPVTLSSPFMQLLVFILDLPSISPQVFHQVLAAIQFMLMVGGSFGLYLFLKYAANLSVVWALLGGCLMFFSAAPLLTHMLSDDGGVFLTCYAIFPCSLLMISQAFTKNSPLYAAWGGVALASQLFWLTPHAEGILYSGVFYGIYTLCLSCYEKALPWRRKFWLCLLTFGAFGVLSLHAVLPILIDNYTGNTITYAHLGDITANDIQPVINYCRLLAIFAPLSWIIFYLRSAFTPVYLSVLTLSLVITGFFWLTTSMDFVTSMVNTFHIGLHVWAPWRIGLFMCCCVFMITMMGMQAGAQCLLSAASKDAR